MKSLKSIVLTLNVILFSLLILTGCQKSNQPSSSIFDELSSESITELTLKTDMTQLLTKSDTSIYQDAKILVVKPDGSSDEFDIEVKTRGVNRKHICAFPPLKFKFAKEDLEKRNLKKYKSLKLVTHCQDGEDFEQVLMKEYLAYKIYNTLTDKSFQVQLVKVNYQDSGSTQSTESHYGFVIENKKAVAERLDARLVKDKTAALKSIDAKQYCLFTLYQYMIGNTDWNLSRHHNVKLFTGSDAHTPFPVPYDFDLSGLVNAPYAKPYPTLPIKTVTERFFQFRGKKDTDFTPFHDLFKSKKVEILNLCAEFELLEEPVKNEMLQYLISFFDEIEAAEDKQVKETIAASDLLSNDLCVQC